MDDNSKRPQFGSRTLKQQSDVFLHNAWDNVEWDEAQEAAAREKVSLNSEIMFSPEEINRLEEEAALQWDQFYGIHQNRFFKDRHWLLTEFPEIAPHLADCSSGSKQNSSSENNGASTSESNEDNGEILESELKKLRLNESYPGENSKFRLLEVGCGVGNTVFPILELNNDPNLFLYCCDFSEVAVNILKESPDYDEKRCNGFVCDISKDDWTTPFPGESLDVIICIFVLSALNPERLQTAVNNMAKFLKPGGVILFRDYGRYDMAQLRFKKGRCVQENFYARGDGTRCYFITQEEVNKLMTNAGLVEVQNIVDRRLQVNRGKQLTMYRVWIQTKYQKPRDIT